MCVCMCADVGTVINYKLGLALALPQLRGANFNKVTGIGAVVGPQGTFFAKLKQCYGHAPRAVGAMVLYGHATATGYRHGQGARSAACVLWLCGAMMQAGRRGAEAATTQMRGAHVGASRAGWGARPTTRRSHKELADVKFLSNAASGSRHGSSWIKTAVA
jgi:hypothetical protein